MTIFSLTPAAPAHHPFAEALLSICARLPEPFTLQDVVEATECHAPDHLEALPNAWACLRSSEQVETVGLCCSAYRLAH